MRLEWIPSEEVQKYMESTGSVISDREEAEFLYHHPTMHWKDKRAYLRVLMERTNDLELKDNLQEYLNKEREELEVFKKPEAGMIFAYVFDQEGFESEIVNLCTTYEAARQQGILEDFDLPFHVMKIPICSEAKLDNPEKWTSVYFEANGEILSTDNVWRDKKNILRENFENWLKIGLCNVESRS